jgi:hypothetical protein
MMVVVLVLVLGIARAREVRSLFSTLGIVNTPGGWAQRRVVAQVGGFVPSRPGTKRMTKDTERIVCYPAPLPPLYPNDLGKQ